MKICSINGCDKKHTGKGLCRTHYMRDYRKKPKQKQKEKDIWQRWYTSNQEHYHNKKRELRQTQEYKDRVNSNRRKRYKSDADFRLMCILRSAFNRFLSGSDSYIIEKLGCSIEELRTHLESQFQPGMSWGNHGKNGWHIDHVIPLAKGNTVKNVYHYSNLQPLWAKDNLIKGGK